MPPCRRAVTQAGLDAAALKRSIGAWRRVAVDHAFLAIADAPGRIAVSHANMPTEIPNWTRQELADLRPLIAHLQRQARGLPPGIMPLGDNIDARAPLRAPVAVIQHVQGRPAVVSAIPLLRAGGAAGISAPPLALAVLFLDDIQLQGIGSRLQLPNLRYASAAETAGPDPIFTISDPGGTPLAHFIWTPRRPGADVFGAVLPFIGIAVAGFIFLAGLVLRYMRQTAAAIAAGESRLHHLAMHDSLSGLPNRHCFGERLETVIAKVRAGGAPAAVFYIDLDHFKDVNDTLGHPVGDELIRSVTLRLSATLPQDALVARLGGDEFALIASAATDNDALHAFAGRLIATLCAPYIIDDRTIVIGASIGIALIDGQMQPAEIMRHADLAMYRAKSEGRNRACVYDAAMSADLLRRKQLEHDLREAIERGDIDVAFQPIVNPGGDRVVGAEALARWTHPIRGPIAPSEFIATAEHAGLIAELGAQVLRRACTEGRAWAGIDVAVNVSPLQFRQPEFAPMIEQILAETGFEASRLELELTESTLLGNLESAEIAMRRLKALGVRLALDDFGTGYSSLQYLRRLPFDRLKIDRSFVLGLETTPDAAAIIQAIVSLGRGLGMKLTAEGVETAEQHLFLRAAGVHAMQGYRFGHPSSAATIAARVANPGVYRSISGDASAALAG